MTIMIVEDLPFIRKIIRRTLKEGGWHNIIEAQDGVDCLEQLEKLKEKNEIPGLILMDIVMPRMDGVTALEEIKRNDPNIPVVMCSSVSDEEAILRSIQLGAGDYIVKPFKKERLVQVAKRFSQINLNTDKED